MLISKAATLINIALLRASPDSVIRTSPVPAAHKSNDVIAPKYFCIGVTLSFPSGGDGGYGCHSCYGNQGSALGYRDIGPDWDVGIYGSTKDVD